MQSLPSFIRYSTVLIILVAFLSALASCGPPDDTTSETDDPPEENSSTEGSSSTNGSTTTPDSKKWGLVEILHGYDGTPSDQFYNVEVTPLSLHSDGGELRVEMSPVVDPGCTQTFVVGWEFDSSVLTVDLGQDIEVRVFNSATVSDCYMQSKASMAYGGEVTIELDSPGMSHFLYQDSYSQYHEGESEYLFDLTELTYYVYPPWHTNISWANWAGENYGNIRVVDAGSTWVEGAGDAPHGNFSFCIDAGQVFTYDVTYLFDAVDE